MTGEPIITIVGNVVRDPDIRVTPGGATVCKFSVASTPRTLDKASGEWRDSDNPLFMDCTAWRDLAENAGETLTKGMRVIVTGRLKQDSWEDKETGAKRSRIVMEVDEVGPSLRWAQASVTRKGGDQARGGIGPQGGRRSSSPVRTNDFDSEPPF